MALIVQRPEPGRVATDFFLSLDFPAARLRQGNPAQVRANSAILSLSLTGHTAVQLATPAGTQANLLLDVTGYFR
jgi:hypothetical protein